MTLGPYDLKYYQYNSLPYGYVLKEWRKACAEFMKQYGEENQVRLFEINGVDDTEGLNKVVTFMISDLLEGRGIPFSPPKIRPWEYEASRFFETLNRKKATKTAAPRRNLWTRLIEFAGLV